MGGWVGGVLKGGEVESPQVGDFLLLEGLPSSGRPSSGGGDEDRLRGLSGGRLREGKWKAIKRGRREAGGKG